MPCDLHEAVLQQPAHPELRCALAVICARLQYDVNIIIDYTIDFDSETSYRPFYRRCLIGPAVKAPNE